MPLAIPEVDIKVYRQGPADHMAMAAAIVATEPFTVIEDDLLPDTRPTYTAEAPITDDHKVQTARRILEFYNVLKANPNNAIEMTDVEGKLFRLTSIGRTRSQPIFFPITERPLPGPFAISAAANVAIVTAAADEEFTLEEAIEHDKIRNREFWHLTIGQPLLTIGEGDVISTNRLTNRQNMTQGQPIILTTDEPQLIRVSSVLMYTYVKLPTPT